MVIADISGEFVAVARPRGFGLIGKSIDAFNNRFQLFLCDDIFHSRFIFAGISQLGFVSFNSCQQRHLRSFSLNCQQLFKYILGNVLREKRRVDIGLIWFS